MLAQIFEPKGTNLGAKGHKFSVISWISSRDLMYIMVFTVNNTIVHLKFTRKVNLKHSPHKKKKIVTIWGRKKLLKIFYDDDLFFYLISRHLNFEYQKWASTDNGNISVIIHWNLPPMHPNKMAFSNLKVGIYSWEHIPAPMQF